MVSLGPPYRVEFLGQYVRKRSTTVSHAHPCHWVGFALALGYVSTFSSLEDEDRSFSQRRARWLTLHTPEVDAKSYEATSMGGHEKTWANVHQILKGFGVANCYAIRTRTLCPRNSTLKGGPSEPMLKTVSTWRRLREYSPLAGPGGSAGAGCRPCAHAR